jgi:hypothetical protein
MDCRRPRRRRHWNPVQSFLLSSLLLGVLVAVGVAAIVRIRSWWQPGPEDRDDWESTLAEYKDLRDRGMLSDEEFRKIRTLVEPRVQSMPMAPSRDVMPAAERADTSDPTHPSEEQN